MYRDTTPTYPRTLRERRERGKKEGLDSVLLVSVIYGPFVEEIKYLMIPVAYGKDII